ncbi:hypothetical protein Mgra_00001749 [Meloidogyne graminicola]|uniref:Uncharacterized protein n=1 Tax=Meloidogyne graminicola TaxID=189291 RepID=A0A8S9ZYG2_9BILA|nr:hypothetical protein Mgra_00001749 [Meloidogyne graminicola]
MKKKFKEDKIEELVKLIESKTELIKDLPKEVTYNKCQEEQLNYCILDELLNINLSIIKQTTNNKDLALNNQFLNFDSKFVITKINWPFLRNLEFRMILDSIQYNNGNTINWFRFWHNEKYQNQQKLFFLYNNERRFSDIMNIIQNKNGYHLDSLLLMSDFIQKEGEFEQAYDFIKRGILACESVYHPSFNICSSNHRLDYSWKENRAFFLLFYRFLLKNIESGNFNSSLEIAKLLFAKDYEKDPLGILLLFDSLALRANCPNFLLDFYEYFVKSKRLDMLPNYKFSIALALHLLGMEEEAVRNFEDALVAFPFVLSQILDYLQIRSDPLIENNYYLNTLASYREPKGLLLLVHIYLHHSNKIWSDPSILNWLETTTHLVLPRLNSVRKQEMDQWAKKRKQIFIGLPENMARHCMINGLFIPETLVLDTNLILGECIQTNPCPPKLNKQEYFELENKSDKEDFIINNGINESKLNERSYGLIISFLRSLLPQSIYEIFCHFLRKIFNNLPLINNINREE